MPTHKARPVGNMGKVCWIGMLFMAGVVFRWFDGRTRSLTGAFGGAMIRALLSNPRRAGGKGGADTFEDFRKEVPMRTAVRWLLSAALAVTVAPVMAQAVLNFNDLVGKWNLMYDDGQAGTFTFSKNDDGTPKVVVSTMAGGESVAKNVVIKGDTITFTRDIAAQGLSGSVTYTAKLVDGALKGAGDVKLAGPDGAAPGGGAPTPFTATKAK